MNLMADNEINFVHVKVKLTDVDHLLGGMWDPAEKKWRNTLVEFQYFTDGEKTLAHLMHRAGLFPSIGQARNNGWNKPIPLGFSQFFVGKKKFGVFILNQHPDEVESCPTQASINQK